MSFHCRSKRKLRQSYPATPWNLRVSYGDNLRRASCHQISNICHPENDIQSKLINWVVYFLYAKLLRFKQQQNIQSRNFVFYAHSGFNYAKNMKKIFQKIYAMWFNVLYRAKKKWFVCSGERPVKYTRSDSVFHYKVGRRFDF